MTLNALFARKVFAAFLVLEKNRIGEGCSARSPVIWAPRWTARGAFDLALRRYRYRRMFCGWPFLARKIETPPSTWPFVSPCSTGEGAFKNGLLRTPNGWVDGTAGPRPAGRYGLLVGPRDIAISIKRQRPHASGADINTPPVSPAATAKVFMSAAHLTGKTSILAVSSFSMINLFPERISHA